MLIITGPGRSGTSLLALLCARLGFGTGGEWHDSVDAGMEDPDIVRMNDAILAELMRGGSATRTSETYRETIRAIRFPVVKDPRFTFHPGLIAAWRSARPDLRVLLTYRDPEDCIRSRKRVRGLMHRNQNKPDAIRRDFANLVQALLALEIEFRLLLFPHFLQQYDRVYAALTALGLEIDREAGARAWKDLVDPGKVHFRTPAWHVEEGS